MSKHNEDFTDCFEKELKGTKTEENLKEAFCGESQARNKYMFFAKQAQKDGYEHIAKIFEETALNEAEHGKIWYKILNGGKMPKTIDNLNSAAGTESYEWQDMYARFAKEAKEEGFEKISNLFECIRKIEKMHMERYQKLVEEIKENTIFSKEKIVTWECAKCGFNCENEEAPEQCPFCKHPKAYFFKKCIDV